MRDRMFMCVFAALLLVASSTFVSADDDCYHLCDEQDGGVMATPPTTANQLPCAITNDDGTITIWFCWKRAIELAAGQKHSAKCRNIVPSEEPKTKKCVETTYNAVQKDGSCGDEEDDCTYTSIPGQDPENFVTEVCADC